MTVSWTPADQIPVDATVRCWLPEDPGRVVGGRWRIAERAAGTLELASSFPTHIVGKDFSSSYEVVHLETSNVVRATLLGCREIGSSGVVGASRDSRAQTIEVETALWGSCLESDELAFTEAWFTTSSLPAFAFPGAFSRFKTDVDTATTRAEYRRPPAITATIGDASVALVADANPAEGKSSVEFVEEVSIRLSWQAAQSWAVVIRPLALRLSDLISFAVRSPNPPVEMRVGGPALVKDYGGHSIMETARVVDADIRPAEAEFETPTRGLFQLRDSPDGLEALANGWLKLEAEVGISLDLLTNLHSGSHESLYSMFFAAAQMLEGYHRAKVGGQRMPHDAFQAIAAQLRTTCPPERMDWLNALLSHANEPSLKARIEALIQRAGHVGVDMTRLRPQFARDVANFRNDYAHLLHPHDVPSQRELVDLLVASEWIMIGCVLQDLGWEDAEAWGRISNHHAYSSATKPLVPIKPRPQPKEQSGASEAQS